MKRQFKKSLVLIFMSTIGFNFMGFAQSTYRIKETAEVDLILSGTSTLHDWEMTALSTTGAAQFVFKANNIVELDAIKSLSFTLQVTDLKGDSDGLNKNAYEALKSNQYQQIRYKLTSSKISLEKGEYLIKSIGKLTVAGVTKDIEMDVNYAMNGDGSINFKGSYNLNMTDYNVEPPSFMWGAMKTSDAVTLSLNVDYKK